MFRSILSRFGIALPNSPSSAGYRPFTTQFDLEVRGNELAKMLGPVGEPEFREYVSEFERALSRWCAPVEIAAIESLRPLKSAIGADRLKDTVASLLIDHSGSLRGQRAMIAAALVLMIGDCWSRLGIAYEILGFTTRSWKGGYSRRSWLWGGRPRNPGRLCDLLHIVYRSADDTSPGAPWAVRNLMRLELLKENVDGEALLWAAGRLRCRVEPRKILVVISDGAPVDDSTLLENGGGYLVQHLREVISAIEATADFRLAAIGLDYEVSDFYREGITIGSPDDMAVKLVPFLSRLVAGP